MLDANFSFRWIAAVARYRLVWLGLPLAMHAWTLAGPFVFDDLHLLRATEDYIAGRRPALDLFRFAPDAAAWGRLRADGDYPWFAPDDRRIDFFRPLPEWLFYLDVRIFGRNAGGHRAMSMAWFALALVCAHRLFRTATRDDVLAGMAAFLLGISQTIAAPATFICNRSDLIVIVGVCLAATAYLEPPVRMFLRTLIAAAGFALALLSKEPAIALAAVFVLDQWLGRRSAALQPRDPARLLITISCTLLALVYLAYYATTRGSALAAAGGDSAIARILTSLGLYSAVWSIGFPASLLLHSAREPILVVAILGAGVMLVALPYLLRLRRRDENARFFGLWAVCFALPALMTVPESRALAVAGVGWVFLIAVLILPREHQPSTAPLWLRHLLLTASGVFAAGCGIGTAWYMFNAELHCRQALRQYTDAQPAPLENGHRLVVARATSPFELIAAGARLEYLLDLDDARVVFLTLPGSDARFERLDDHRIRVWSEEGTLMNSPAHRLTLGAGVRPRVGQTFDLPDFSVAVESLRPNGEVSSFVVTLQLPLDDPRLHFYPPSLLTQSGTGELTAPRPRPPPSAARP